MSTTAAYDARPFRDALYADHPEMATLDLLDDEDLRIARLARERFEQMARAQESAWRWSESTMAHWWQSNAPLRWRCLEIAVLDLHPNPVRSA